MTNEQMNTLVEKTLGDSGFAARLVTTPAEVAAELGIELSADETAALSDMSVDDVQAFSREYQSATDPAMRRAAC